VLPSSLEFLRPIAASLGFVAIGAAPAGPVGKDAEAKYRSWLEREYHANLDYMARNLEQRCDLTHPQILSEASVVVIAALPYGAGTISRGFWKYVATYARARDYHKTVRSRLQLLAGHVTDVFSESRCRVFVDTAPVMERYWAHAAQIGSVGKNGAVIVPQVGPCVVLGEIVCTHIPHSLVSGLIEPNRVCEGCSRCIEACPTGALMSNGGVDCNRCLSYWTIENGQEALPNRIAAAATQIFGCDICTTICPANNPDQKSRLELPPSSDASIPGLCEIVNMDDQSLLTYIVGTPLKRTGPTAIRRNIRAVIQK